MVAKYPFNPAADIPDLAGKVIFITGGTAGLGKATCLSLAAHNPAHIYISGRNAKRGSEVVEIAQKAFPAVQVTFLEFDLADLDSVVGGAKKFASESKRLDILFCNAGIMAVPEALTKDGYEIQFGTNHVGQALLIKLLLPIMLETQNGQPESDVRVISNTSMGYSFAAKDGIRFEDVRNPKGFGFLGGWKRYGRSKLANLLYAAELARRYPSITSVAVHPGVIGTDLIGNLGLLSKVFLKVGTFGQEIPLEEGVKNQLWAATTKKDSLVNGRYYIPVGEPGPLDGKAKDDALASQLWDWTDKELERFGSI